MMPVWLIEKKRDGAALADGEIRFFIDGFTAGTIPDYQMAAMAMAIFFRGMSFDEVATLTDAMMRSGRVMDLASIGKPTADKHSTGGVGDKVSLLLAPLVACCGVAVPMISGRGLGITGGTLDKLESIPGYRTRLTTEEFLAALERCGCSIIGQTGELAPADRKLYALRDVTGTVPSIPLISASIMSKKLAEGAGSLVLDVTWGSGAFMRSVEQARDLACAMVEIGRRMGRRMTALITDMNQPLGRTAGNALEVMETVDALRGDCSADLKEITLELGAHMLLLARVASSREAALETLRRQWSSGAALERFLLLVREQGGDARAVEEGRLPRARFTRPVCAAREGFVVRADAEAIGKACILLGAGRRKVDDEVDPAAGASGIAKVGGRVAAGEPLLTLHASDESRLAEAEQLAAGAFSIEPEARPAPRLIVEALT